MRIAVIDRDKCTNAVCGYQCMKICPGVKMREEVIVIDSASFPVINEELCTGCGLCVKRCPVDAIRVINLPGETGRPTFQYGPNTFRLYGMVLPKEKSVVGIIGVNGIGKTTALQMVAGTIKPNFGHFHHEATWEEIRKEFRGQEIQPFLEKVAAKSVRVSHKMQYVDALAKGKGSARELLKACDEQNAFERLASEFELSAVLDRKLSELSGGELQRLAIACTIARKAEVYVFDEPSSYLDVRQRLRMASKIRELSAGASIIVVEHDLGVLDYLSDYVHVFFGSRGVYGFVSSLKSGKNGINEYLDGYLKDENMRFRPHSIKFEVLAPTTQKGRVCESYSEFSKKFAASSKNSTGFSLSAEPGSVFEGEVLGILGPNAIGKSTFVKILAGVEAPSEGAGFSEKMRVAYKPQYPQANVEGTVRELIDSQKDLNKVLFNSEVRESLEISELMEKTVKHLSGGELQRVSIGITLCRDAGVRLLDEPSAFLDVEQRLKAATVIRRIAEVSEVPCFVVDHDVLFIDRVANRIILFDGEPGVSGRALAPQPLRSGMNAFLKQMGITFRRDVSSGRPRANKPESALDREQKDAGEYYYYDSQK